LLSTSIGAGTTSDIRGTVFQQRVAAAEIPVGSMSYTDIAQRIGLPKSVWRGRLRCKRL